MTGPMHPDQLDVAVATVARLVADQFPRWRHLPVAPVESAGTVNAIFRIGEGLTARLPLRYVDPEAARTWLADEAAAARELAAYCPVRTPLPVALGEPGPGYPLPWAVTTWLPGRTASEEDPAGSRRFAVDLGALLTALRSASTRGRRFAGAGRGGDLRDHDAWVAECLDRSVGLVDVAALRRLWRELRALPPVGPDVMSHGDLVPGNVLVRAGRLDGVLDGGGFGPADPALDLVAAWQLLNAGPRRDLRRLLGCGELEWARGRAWALAQAIGLVWYYADTNPSLSRIGRRTLDRVLGGS